MPAQNTDNAITRLLDANGFTFNPSTKKFEVLEGEVPPVFQTGPGKRLLGLAQEMKDQIEVAGGVEASKFLDFMKELSKSGKFSRDISGDQVAGLSRQLRSAMAEDRNENLSRMLREKGLTDEADYADSIFAEFNDKIDTIRMVRRLSDNGRRATLLARGLAKKNRPEDIERLKYVLGENSEAWGAFRGNWLADQINAAKNAQGVVDPEKFRSAVLSKSPEVAEEILGPSGVAQVKGIWTKMMDTPIDDLLAKNPNEGRQRLTNTVASVFNTLKSYQQRARVLNSWFGSSIEASRYLNEEGLRELAKLAKTPEEKRAALKTMNLFGRLINASVVKKTGRGKDILVSRSLSTPLREATSPEDSEVEQILRQAEERDFNAEAVESGPVETEPGLGGQRARRALGQ